MYLKLLTLIYKKVNLSDITLTSTYHQNIFAPRNSLISTQSSKMQPDLYYLSILPHTLTLHKSIIYQVHPLTKYRLQLLRNSQLYDNTKGWVYAGSHNGLVQFPDQTQMEITLDATMRTNFFSLRLLQIKYSLFKDVALVNNPDQQEILGKNNLFIKKYLNKFMNDNIHSFQQNSHITNNFILHYHVFIERTPQGLNRIIQQHQRLNTQNRPRKGSAPESIKSSTFSDKINQIEVKGENRFVEKAHQAMQGQFAGSQSKLSPPFNSLNLKTKIKRSGRHQETNQKSGRHQATNQISHKKLFTKSRFYNQPFTERKARDQANQENQQLSTENKQPNQEQMLSPPLQPLNLKKLNSEEVKVNFDLLSPDKLKNTKIHLENGLSHEEKKRKLLDEFQRKRIQFKKRIDSEKLLGNPIPEPLTDRQLKRSNSMRSMRSVKSVRLTELERLPQEKPWVKKEKEKAKKLQKKIIVLLYIVMQPNRNLQADEILMEWSNKYVAEDRKKYQRRTRQKKIKGYTKQ